MSDSRNTSPVRKGHRDRTGEFRELPRRTYSEKYEERRDFRSGPSPNHSYRFDPRRNGRGRGGYRGKPENRWDDRRVDGGRPRSDQGFYQQDNRGFRKRGDFDSKSGFGDHCRDKITSELRSEKEGGIRRDLDYRREAGKTNDKNVKSEEDNVDARSDLKKEIGKIKKALNLSTDKTGNEGDKVEGSSNKRKADDDLEKQKKKKKKRKSKGAVASSIASEVKEKDEIIPKTKEVVYLEKDNSLLRNKLQEVLDENMKSKVDYLSLKRKWDDAEIRITKLEDLARDKDAKIVELEHENNKQIEKLESSKQTIADLEKDYIVIADKLDTKRTFIRQLDAKILAKDEKYELIKNEVEEKEGHLIKYKQVKDELFKSNEALFNENEEIKTLAKGISEDSDVLVKNIAEKDELISTLQMQLHELRKKGFIDSSITEAADTDEKFNNSVDKGITIIKDDVRKSEVANDLIVESDHKAMDSDYEETTLSEKCDSSVGIEDDEHYDLDEDVSLAIGDEVSDSLFEPLSDKSNYSDDDIDLLKVTSVENKQENLAVVKAEELEAFPFKLKRFRKYSGESSPKKSSYKIYYRKLYDIEVPCINAVPGSSRKMMISLDDFVKYFQPKLSVKRVGIILEEFHIPLYKGNTYQQETLSRDTNFFFHPVPLVLFEDLEKYKYDLESLFSKFTKGS